MFLRVKKPLILMEVSVLNPDCKTCFAGRSWGNEKKFKKMDVVVY